MFTTGAVEVEPTGKDAGRDIGYGGGKDSGDSDSSAGSASGGGADAKTGTET